MVSRYVRIGLFVALSTVGTVIYVMQTAEVVGNGRTYTVHAYVDNAAGLLPDSAVKIAGVEVGKLTEVELDGTRARLTLEIREDVQLREDAVISKVSESILGTSTVAITPGNGQGALLTDGDVVRNVARGESISSVVGSAGDLATNASELIAKLNEYLTNQDTVEALSEIVEVVRQTARSTSLLLDENLKLARATMQNIESFSARLDQQSVAQLSRVQEILTSTANITANLDRLVGENDTSMATSITSIEENLASLQRVLTSIESSAEDIAEVTSGIREGEGTIGKLVTDDELYTRVANIAESAEGFVDSTVGMGVQVGYEGYYLTTQERSKNLFEARLLPREEGSYYTVGLVRTPIPSTATKVTRTTGTMVDENNPSTTLPINTVTTEEIERDELKINLQMARSWGPLTLRAGMFEGTAGVGLDLQPISQLSLSYEAFDFAGPRVYMRGVGRVYPFFQPDSTNPLRWIYLSGGVEDLLDSYQRDYFFGAGVRVTDNDLRALVGFIPLN